MSIINVAAGDNLQTAINAANLGDEVSIQVGATFTGPFTLPNKTGASGLYLTIRAASLSGLPAGVRVNPSQASLMPKIASAGAAEAAIQTLAGAHHYKLIGLEIAPTNDQAFIYDLILLGSGDGNVQYTAAQTPHNLIIDRCYIHAYPTQSLKRGIALNSASTDITNSYVSDFKAVGQDSQAIGGWNGPGPYNIINNHLEGSGEVILFGGAEPGLAGLVPSDILVQRNTLTKQVAWRGVWLCKNVFELKSARRVQVVGNIIENNWADGQVGYPIVLTPGNGSALASAQVQDVLITNNVVRHAGAGVNILGYGYFGGTAQASLQTNNISVVNNFFDDIDSVYWGGVGRFLQITESNFITFDHNTVLHSNHVILAYSAACQNFVFKNNIANHNEYGIYGDGYGSGNAAIAQYFPGSTILKNVIAGANSNSYPTDNFYPALLDLEASGRLKPDSLYLTSATDGTAVGCDFDALALAMGLQARKLGGGGRLGGGAKF